MVNRSENRSGGRAAVVVLIPGFLTIYRRERRLRRDRGLLVSGGKCEKASFDEGVGTARKFANQKGASSVKFIIQHGTSVADIARQVTVIS
jgi:hypothetical protein